MLTQAADRLTHGGDTSVMAKSHGEHSPVMGCILLLTQEAGRLTHEGDTFMAEDSHGEHGPVVGRALCC